MGSPDWHAPAFLVLLAVGLAVTWRLAAAQLPPAGTWLARGILVLGAAGAAVVAVDNGRDRVRLRGLDLELVPRFSLESVPHPVREVRWFDVQQREAGVGVRSDLEPYLVLGLRDGSAFELPMALENAERLRALLRAQGVREGRPLTAG